MVHVGLHKLFSLELIILCTEVLCKYAHNTNKFQVIRKTKIFIDKTLLLKKVLQYDYILLTAPHKFGKSTNMDMIKLFLGNNIPKIDVADVFRGTNIWEDRKFIVKHVSNYPIIYCNFKSKSTIRTFKDVDQEMRMAVRDAYEEHTYLLESQKISMDAKKQFVKFTRLQVVEYELGLKFLSKLLQIHHGRKVVLLIDDYDFPLTYSIFKEELDSTSTAKLIFRMIDNTINMNDFVERSIIMGCVPFKLGTQFSGLYLLEHFKFMETKDFTPYFGFTQKETSMLLDKFGLIRLGKNVSDWYCGYSYLRSDFHICNPWSVLMFLKTKKFDIYWVPPAARKQLYQNIEPHYQLKEHFSELINHKNLTIQAVSSFTTFEVDKLKSVQFASYSYAEDYTEHHLFLQLLLESGYLTYGDKYRVLPISTKVKLPNIEIEKVFKQILVKAATVYPDINRLNTIGNRQNPLWERSFGHDLEKTMVKLLIST